MSIQNLNVFEANHLSGTSYVLFERYFFPRSFFVENFDVLSFLLYYTTPKQIGSNLLSAKSWVPTRNRWMCPECGAKKAPSIAWLFGGSFWWWNFGPGSKWLKPSIFLPGSGLFSEADEWMVTKVVYPPRKKKQYAHNPINGGHPHMVQLWGNCNGRTTAGAAEPLDRGFVWWNRWNLQQNNLVFRSIEMSKSSWQYGKKMRICFQILVMKHQSGGADPALICRVGERLTSKQ